MPLVESLAHNHSPEKLANSSPEGPDATFSDMAVVVGDCKPFEESRDGTPCLETFNSIEAGAAYDALTGQGIECVMLSAGWKLVRFQVLVHESRLEEARAILEATLPVRKSDERIP